MSSPFCALLVFDFTSIWAILEPQSSTRLGNRLFDREICSIELSWVGAECSPLTIISSVMLHISAVNVINSNTRILEPQSSTRLGSKINYLTIMEGRLRSRSVTRKSMAKGRTH